MDVILFETVPNLGSQGSIVSVTPGYFRNYLSPRQLAVEATEANKRRLQEKLRRFERQAQEELHAAKTEAEKLEALTLTFRLKAGEDDRLFGSVTNAQIADELAKHGYQVDRHRIAIPEPIKGLGMYTVEVRVHHDVVGKVKVLVEKQETVS
ncbi:MAG TPA: 50S ribosomal protein L9 [Sumerlaeia bacterium]|nr:50S ribosomal protein L9 [Sumerlaeia bacterium]